MRTERAQQLRQVLRDYYTKHAPDNVDKADELVARVVGGPPTSVGGTVVGGILWTEEELFEKLEAKYGAKVDLDPHISEQELIRELNLDYIMDNPWIVIPVSALKTTNVDQVVQWLMRQKGRTS